MGSEHSAPNSSISNIYCLGALVFELCDGVHINTMSLWNRAIASLSAQSRPACKTKQLFRRSCSIFAQHKHTPACQGGRWGGGGLGDGSG